ncbi:MAG: hypothetical protein ACXV1K_12110 [Kineosporiaceae bacterium]
MKQTVRIRLVWIPTDRAERRGRVILERALLPASHRAVPSFWTSESMTARELLGSSRCTSAAAWWDVLLSRPVETLPAPVMLRRADAARLEALARLLRTAEASATSQRPLVLVVADVDAAGCASASAGTAGDASAGLASLRVVRFSGDVLSHAFDGVFELAPDGLVRSEATVSGIASARHLGTLTSAWETRIRSEDVRAARDEARSVRVSRVLLQPKNADDDVRAVLRTPGVAAAIGALRPDPRAHATVDALVAALRDEGWGAEVDDLTLDLGEGVTNDVPAALDALVVVGVRNAENHDLSRVVLVPVAPAASALLRRHDRLAQALAAYVIPPPGPFGAEPQLRRELRAAVADVGATVSGSAGLTTGP